MVKKTDSGYKCSVCNEIVGQYFKQSKKHERMCGITKLTDHLGSIVENVSNMSIPENNSSDSSKQSNLNDIRCNTP